MKSKSFFDKIESFYLGALRIFLLIVSTVLFIYTVFIGMTSIYGISRSADSVIEAKPVIQSSDIIPASASSKIETADNAVRGDEAKISDPGNEPDPFDQHAARMFEIWQADFEVHKKEADPKVTNGEFSAWYSNAWAGFTKPQWCQDDACTDVENQAFESDLKLAETVIKAAASDADMRARMSKASSGQKDAYDQAFVELNRNFWDKLTQERNANRELADAEKENIAASNVAGSLGLITAAWSFAAFISFMFGFLLVAIERHQRKMAADLQQLKESQTS